MLSQRTYYNRISKATTTSAQSNKGISTALPSNPISIQHYKQFGVRKVLKKDDTQLSSSDQKYKHGLENPLIQSLINSNPALLSQCLAYKNYLDGRPCGDYVLSLYLQGQQNELRGRKRGSQSQQILAIESDFDDENNNRSNKRSKTVHCRSEKNEEANGGSIPCTKHDDLDTKRLNQDIIEEEELLYLHDVLCELKRLQNKHSEQTLFSVAKSTENKQLLREPIVRCDEDGGNDDGLIWLTKEMEREWLQFLHFSGPIANMEHDDYLFLRCDKKTTHCFKAYISLGRRTQCDLGYFSSPKDAARIFDMYAIGRRTLGKIALREYDLRKRVKARSIVHQLNEQMCKGNVSDATENIRSRVCDLVDGLKVDSYFCSEKVLFPDLNTNVDWKSAEPFGLDTSRYAIKSKERIDNEGMEVVKDLISDSPPLSWLQNEMKDLRTEDPPDEEDVTCSHDLDLIQKKEELKNLNRNLSQRIFNVERLVLLERMATQLIEKAKELNQHLIQPRK